MNNVPCANTFYLNQYMKTLDGEAKWEEAVEKKMEEVRLCVTRLMYCNHVLYSPVLVAANQNFSPIVHPIHGEGIWDDSSEDHYKVSDALAEGKTMQRAWAENKVNDTLEEGQDD